MLTKEVVVVFDEEQAELMQVLLDDPFLYEDKEDSVYRIAMSCKEAIQAGINGAREKEV